MDGFEGIEDIEDIDDDVGDDGKIIELVFCPDELISVSPFFFSNIWFFNPSFLNISCVSCINFSFSISWLSILRLEKQVSDSPGSNELTSSL